MIDQEGFTAVVVLIFLLVNIVLLLLFVDSRYRKLIDKREKYRIKKTTEERQKMSDVFFGLQLLNKLTDYLLNDGWEIVGGDKFYGRFRKYSPAVKTFIYLQMVVDKETGEVSYDLDYKGEQKNEVKS